MDDMPLMEMFREEVQLQCGNFRTALAARDGESMMLAAHSARGAAKILDIGLAASLAKELEGVAMGVKNGKIALSDATAALMAEANELLAQLAAPDADLAAWGAQPRRGELEAQLAALLS